MVTNAKPSRDREPSLELKCNACQKTFREELGRPLVHPEFPRCPGWDGVLLMRVVVCEHCGAEDDYELTPGGRLAITAEVIKGHVGEESVVTSGEAELWDGTVVRRASQGLAALRRAVAEEPGSALRWRRLGNFALRFDRLAEAEEAYLKAIDLDERDVEAANSLAEILWSQERFAEGCPFVGLTIERLPQHESKPDLAKTMARSTFIMLRESMAQDRRPLALMAAWDGGGSREEAVVHVSSVDLRRLSDAEWNRLADLLAEKHFMTARLTREVPDKGEPTQLEELLSRRTFGIRPYVPPPPGRNRPCPCGSGKKRKVCCGG